MKKNLAELLPEGPIVQGAENSAFVRCSLFVRGAVIKAIWTFSKFSLIPLWKGFGGVTHGSLLDPEFGRFTSDKAHFSDQNEAQILEFLRKKRIRETGK